MKARTILALFTLFFLRCVPVLATETVTYYYGNPQGTPLATADAAGNILSTSDYRPYGVQALGAAEPGPGYTGHINDPGAGLVYMQARYYDPVVGRFLSADPLGPSGGNVFGFSRYAYASGNPISNTDPSGMAECGPACRALRQVSDSMGFSSLSLPPARNSGPLGQANAGMSELNTDLKSAGAAEARGAADVADLAPGASAIACASGAQCSAGEMVGAAATIGFPEFDAAEIEAINATFNEIGGVAMADKVIANMYYREGTIAKAAVVIRDLAGGHLFSDGNSRTAQVLAERMLAGKVTPEKIRAVVDAVSERQIRTVEDISHALEH
jgi:RHS repeat-associated protein